MSDRGLHLIYKDGEISRSGDLLLTLDSKYEFTLYVKEYLEEKEKMIKRLQDDYIVRFHSREKKGWTDARKKENDADFKDTQTRLTEIFWDRDKDLIQKFDDVRFIYILAKNGVNTTSKAATHVGNKIKINRTLPEIAIGGGKVYLEAIRQGTQPKNAPPHGIFVSALGNPKVLGILWTDYDDNEITEEIAPGSHVLLHIYTKDMYGQEIDVVLRDDDKMIGDSDDDLSDKESDQEPDEMAGKEIYRKRCEVNLYPIGKVELSSAIMGKIEDIDSNTSTVHVQKAIMPLRVSNGSLWKKEAGSVAQLLHIYPSILSVEQQIIIYDVDDNFLKVNYKKKKLPQPQLKEYRTPVKINQVNTLLGAWGPCYFSKITANVESSKKEEGKSLLPEILLFDETNSDLNSIRRFILPVTAGIKNNTTKITINIDTDTNSCINEDTETDHENRIIDLSQLNRFSKKGIVTGHYIGWNKNNNATKTEFYDNSPIINFGKLNINPTENLQSEALEKIALLRTSKPFQLKVEDTQINMEVAYSYSDYGNQNFLWGLAKSLLPTGSNTFQAFPIKINTCRYPNRLLEIHVYPDIKWTLQVAFKYNKDKFNKVREAYHNKYETIVQETDQQLQAAREEKEKKYDATGKKKKRFNKEADTREVKRLEVQKANAEKQNTLKGKAKKFFDLLEPDDALENDIIEFEAGLTCEFDGGEHNVEISSLFPEVLDFIRKIAKLKKKVDEVINGEGESTQSTPNNDVANNRTNALRERTQQMEKKKPSGWSFEFLPPEIGVSLSWYAERPNDVNTPQMGISIEGVIHADPILGFEVKYDIFKLLGKVPHPIVKGVVMTLEVLDDVLGDKFDIDLDFVLTGKTYAYGKGKFNSIAQSSYRNRSDEVPFKLGGSLGIGIEGRIYAAARVDSVFWGKAEGYVDMKASVASGFALEGQLASNGTGELSWDTIFRFEGIVIKGSFTAGVILGDKGGKEIDEDDNKAPEDPIDEKGLHYTTEGELIVMDSCEWKF